MENLNQQLEYYLVQNKIKVSKTRVLQSGSLVIKLQNEWRTLIGSYPLESIYEKELMRIYPESLAYLMNDLMNKYNSMMNDPVQLT
jgi:hypothetical protein